MFSNFGSDTLKAIYTISATIIGAGILALPVYLSSAGFLPGAIMIILVGTAAIFSALFIAETLLRFKENLHLPRLAQKLLGTPGLLLMFSGILIYIYGALVGYLSCGGQVIYEITQGALAHKTGIFIYFIIGAIVVYLGIKAVKTMSFVLFSLMLIAFIGILSFTFQHMNFDLLGRANWSGILPAFGILIFAFTGHTIIPSLSAEMRKNAYKLKKVCLWGVLLPLIIYIIWFFVLCSVVPYGDSVSETINPLLSKTLIEAKTLGQPATIPLAHLIGAQILILAVFFTLLSTFTSFLGFGISLKDVYIDVAKRKFLKKTALIFALVPPLFLALWHPFSFLEALEIAGFYGGGLFMGILPPLMVLRARKIGERIPEFVAPGGAIAPIVVFLFFLFAIIYKTYSLFIFE
jgi:amino acid permease